MLTGTCNSRHSVRIGATDDKQKCSDVPWRHASHRNNGSHRPKSEHWGDTLIMPRSLGCHRAGLRDFDQVSWNRAMRRNVAAAAGRAPAMCDAAGKAFMDAQDPGIRPSKHGRPVPVYSCRDCHIPPPHRAVTLVCSGIWVNSIRSHGEQPVKDLTAHCVSKLLCGKTRRYSRWPSAMSRLAVPWDAGTTRSSATLPKRF